MIPKHLKLSLRSEKRFFQKSKKVFLQTMTCFWSDSEETQFVVIVPKKQVQLATDRNRIKRQVTQEVFKQLKEKGLNENTKHFVIVIKNHPKFEEFHRKDIETTLTRLNLFVREV